MPFRDLPEQSSVGLRADAYAGTALRLSRLAAMTTRVALDIPYGPEPGQALDIYLPAADISGPLPVFVNIHGGAWTHGCKEWMGLNAPAITAFPAIYVSLSYRLAPAHKHPIPFEDCLAGFAWVHAHIAGYGGDRGRLFVGGHSAGGQLAALIALRRDLLASRGLPEDVVKACFPYSGVFDMTYAAADGRRALVPMCEGLVAGTGVERDASPLHCVGGNRTPFLVSWAENDNPFCKHQGPEFAAALKREPGRVAEQIFPLFDHFWIHIDQQRAANVWTRTLRSWMAGDPETAEAFQP
jgi:acetyl esterase/lipase